MDTPKGGKTADEDLPKLQAIASRSAEPLLAYGTDEDAVRSLVEQARQAGISGVPFFIINGEHALSGAQPPDAFIELLDQVTQHAASAH